MQRCRVMVSDNMLAANSWEFSCCVSHALGMQVALTNLKEGDLSLYRRSQGMLERLGSTCRTNETWKFAGSLQCRIQSPGNELLDGHLAQETLQGVDLAGSCSLLVLQSPHKLR